MPMNLLTDLLSVGFGNSKIALTLLLFGCTPVADSVKPKYSTLLVAKTHFTGLSRKPAFHKRSNYTWPTSRRYSSNVADATRMSSK